MSSRKEDVKRLVAASQTVKEQVEAKYSTKIRFSLENREPGYTDVDGWMLSISQLGETPEDIADNYFAPIAWIQISELEVNGGLPVVKLYKWRDESSVMQESGSGASIKMTTDEVLAYLNHIAEHGDAVTQVDPQR